MVMGRKKCNILLFFFNLYTDVDAMCESIENRTQAEVEESHPTAIYGKCK
jgi:hypothetical protein